MEEFILNFTTSVYTSTCFYLDVAVFFYSWDNSYVLSNSSSQGNNLFTLPNVLKFLTIKWSIFRSKTMAMPRETRQRMMSQWVFALNPYAISDIPVQNSFSGLIPYLGTSPCERGIHYQPPNLATETFFVAPIQWSYLKSRTIWFYPLKQLELSFTFIFVSSCQ